MHGALPAYQIRIVLEALRKMGHNPMKCESGSLLEIQGGNLTFPHAIDQDLRGLKVLQHERVKYNCPCCQAHVVVTALVNPK